MLQNLDQLRVIDPILTEFSLGYKNPRGVGTFIAPIVPVNSRAGKVLVFGKEQFAYVDGYRAPGTAFKRVNSDAFGVRPYVLRQEGFGFEVTEEQDREALTGAAKLSLRNRAVQLTAARLVMSHEVQVANLVMNPANYEGGNVVNTNSVDKWNATSADVEVQIDYAKEQVRSTIGVYPNKMVLSPQAFNALKRNKVIREYLQRGAVVTEQVLASIFGLDEIRVASSLVADSSSPTGLRDIFYDTALLFYQSGSASDGLTELDDIDQTTPTSFMTYQLTGTPFSTPERFDEDYRIFKGETIVERSVESVGLGPNGLNAAAFLWLNTTSGS